MIPQDDNENGGLIRMSEKELLKEHPSLKGYIFTCHEDLHIVHETQLDKAKVKEVIDKLISESHDIYSFVNNKKIKEVEFFGNDKRELRERGYMRWAFEDGGSEALIKLKKEIGLE